MGFLKREVTKNSNPTSKFLEWKSNNKSLAFTTIKKTSKMWK